ncbi:MAG: TraR/DksA C4-type zinc finger protein [Thermodesulfovibrionales bacterium]|nr:TraR/DksA C4-type zinc finger protein [Thermodesulfovibrionales bacterium]
MAKKEKKLSKKTKKATTLMKVKKKAKPVKKAKKAEKKKAIKRKRVTEKKEIKSSTTVVTAPPGAVTDAERKEKLKRFLLNMREKILSEAKTEIAKYMKGETKQIVETALDDGDWSVVDLAEDISLRQLTAHRENLIKVDTALRKLEEGTYGICEECGEEITEERLKILPFAIYCRECQERKEILEKIEKEYE